MTLAGRGLPTVAASAASVWRRLAEGEAHREDQSRRGGTRKRTRISKYDARITEQKEQWQK
jgi:hypothetical protein